jgi:putative aldouronate transport system permease protein
MHTSPLPWRILVNAVLALFCLACILPFVLLVMSSVSEERSIIRHGYSFVPKVLSLGAYAYLLLKLSEIGRAYLITVGVTAVGTVTSLLITSLLAYPLSRRDLPFRKAAAFYVFFTMLFNGGLVPTYLVYTQIFHIKNTLFALLVPGLLMNGFNVFIMRTFFMNSIPPAVIESARIDGAGEFRTYWSIVMPLSLPILATIGLFAALAYWNDWFNGFIYLTDQRLFSIQNILSRILQDVQFLTSSSNVTSQMAEMLAKIPSTSVRMAIAVLGAIPIIVAYPFFQRYFVKGITIGAVKG